MVKTFAVQNHNFISSYSDRDPAISQDHLILFSSYYPPRPTKSENLILKNNSGRLFGPSQSLSTVIPLYTYLHALLVCAVYVYVEVPSMYLKSRGGMTDGLSFC